MIHFNHRPGSTGFFGLISRATSGRGLRIKLFTALAVVLMAILGAAVQVRGQQYDSSFYAGMRWRSIGPFRAGRSSAVAGVPGNPAHFYMGTPGGGLWETTDGGTVWQPIMDQIAVASIGAVVVAPSNPNIIYVGTGDVSNVGAAVNQGNGVYRSDDAGKTWHHVGLDDSRHIGTMWIDPNNPDVVLAAALGHTYAPNEQRGVFKTTDGGKTWRKVLYKDDVTGAMDLAFDPANPKIGFATLWHHYSKPGDIMALFAGFSNNGIYKTTDEGETWTPIIGHGLPTERLSRIGVAVAPGGQRVFAIVAALQGSGLYRSDDGGNTWKKSSDDPRVTGNGYFSRVYLDPHNPEIVYVMQTSMYRSTDGGHTFIAYKGAPGGDDNHVLWIDPTNSNSMIMGSDQGATISLDGGKTWSTWYNQPTAQVYHLSVDNRFPYWVYGTMQDSGSIGGLSRGDYGKITMLDWDAIGAYEFGYILPDPRNPNLIYAGGEGRGLVRLDRSNRQDFDISPNLSRDSDYRFAINPPLAFSPQDPRILYEGSQFVLETRDGGLSWKAISPELTKRPEAAPPEPENKENAGLPKLPDRTSINTLSPSPVKSSVIWAGTTNGLVQVTQDGGATWQLVSPPGLTKFSLISLIDASHFDAATAYVAVDSHETNDWKSHFFRTHDFGRTWQEISAGIPEFSFARAIREDTVRKGLLYAGTETAVFVSFDDGDHWQSLQLNMPVTSVRDLVVHGDDLVICTYGRAFWILDDVTPLRQINSQVQSAEVHLFQPAAAIRVRNNMNYDTPFPPEMPAADNPPPGAVIDYCLKSAPSGDISLAIYDTAGALVREYSSKPGPPSTEPPPSVPDYWLLRPQPMPKEAGMNRFVWDLRYTPPLSLRHDYAIAATYMSTPPDPRGPFVVPGKYEARLTVDGKTYRQTFSVEKDPRVKVTEAELFAQLELEKKIIAATNATFQAHQQVVDFRSAISERLTVLEKNEQAKPAADALKALDKKAGEILGGGGGGFGFFFGKPKPSLSGLNGEFGNLATAVDAADSPLTEAMKNTYADYCKDYTGVLSQWNDLLSKDFPAANAQLTGVKLDPLPAPPALPAASACAK
ncbi:MAG: WD40/YVTN/BNR-like repeat-containing protein [Candidatus Acidiferrales bacterium]